MPVFEFAELQEFKELRLKNYSSGMTVRLAFAVMIQADTDILLIDEVLAVGDASFQQKCADVFHGMRDSGKTVVLVTHDMGAIETYCDRAMLIHDGDVVLTGDPDEVAKSYYRLNFEAAGADPDALAMSQDALSRAKRGARPRTHESSRPRSRTSDGNAISEPRAGRADPVPRALFEAVEELRNPLFSFLCASRNGTHVFGFRRSLERDDDEVVIVPIGERIELVGHRREPADARQLRAHAAGSRAKRRAPRSPSRWSRLADFMVYGGTQTLGLVEVEVEVEATTVEGE